MAPSRLEPRYRTSLVGLEIRRAVLLLFVLASPAAGEPERAVAVRVSVAVGALEEATWLLPEVDLVGTLPIRERGFVTLAAGYASLDNHTFLADGRTFRLAAAGGATVFGRVRAAAGFGLELVAFHADPDVLTEHPDVDILETRGGLMPSASLELSHPIGASTAMGVFTRVGLTRLTLFETSSGERSDSRLVLAGAFIELQIR
jgi:hypothetical protein